MKAHPEARALHYNLACLEAVQGRREAALAALGKALELSPGVAAWARDDEDFARLRDDPEFRLLVDG
jgi:adenylate cyclase